MLDLRSLASKGGGSFPPDVCHILHGQFSFHCTPELYAMSVLNSIAPFGGSWGATQYNLLVELDHPEAVTALLN